MKNTKKTIFNEQYGRLIDKLVSIRKSKNITQRNLAKMLNVSHCYIARTEIKERRLDVIELISYLKILDIQKPKMLEIIDELILEENIQECPQC